MIVYRTFRKVSIYNFLKNIFRDDIATARVPQDGRLDNARFYRHLRT